VSVKMLANVGSCDNAWLQYIIENYDALPPAVLFTKPDMIGWPPKNVCETSASTIGSFHLADYKFRHNPVDRPELQFRPSGFRDMREWAAAQGEWAPTLLALIDRPIASWIGGNNLVTVRQIRSQPIGLYRYLRGLQTHANEEVDHFIERLWAPMLCPAEVAPR